MTLPISSISFDLAEAVKQLSERDEKLKFLIAETQPFQMDQDHLQSPYEVLLEAIAYQSISGKAAALFYHSLFTDPDLKGAPIDWLDGGKLFVESCAAIILATSLLRARHARTKVRSTSKAQQQANLGT